MLRQIILLSFGISFFLEGMPCYDEALSRQNWSNFGPLCKHYVIGRKEKPEAVYEILKSYVKSDATILDLGSGTGISTRQLCRNGFVHVIGVDRDPFMIKEAQAANRPNCSIRYIRADVSGGLPFPDEEFDVVTASSAFHWFSNPTSVREVARILKPQGYYFIVGGKSRKGKNKSHATIKEHVRQILKEAGVPPKPNKYAISTVDALEGQGFNIIIDTEVPFAQEYTKKEFLALIQSQTSWNLVPEAQKEQVLKKIDQYLDTLLNSDGKLKEEGFVSVILGQKR